MVNGDYAARPNQNPDKQLLNQLITVKSDNLIRIENAAKSHGYLQKH